MVQTREFTRPTRQDTLRDVNDTLRVARSEEPRGEREAREARDEEQGDQKRDSRHENANEPVSALYDGSTALQEVCAVYQAGINVLERTVLSYSSLITPTSVWPVWLCPSGPVTLFDDDPQRECSKTAVRGCA